MKCFAKNFIRLLISYLHKKVKLSQNSYILKKEKKTEKVYLTKITNEKRKEKRESKRSDVKIL